MDRRYAMPTVLHEQQQPRRRRRRNGGGEAPVPGEGVNRELCQN